MNAKKGYFILVTAVIILISCSPSVIDDPKLGPFVTTGQAENRDLGTSIENVWNCGSGGGTIIKHPSQTNITNYSVEWDVGGIEGVGVKIGEDVIPGGVDLSKSLDGLLVNSQQATSWDLPAEPNTSVDYTLAWHETWEIGYVDVTLSDNSVIKVNFRYRTNIGSELVDKQVKPCGVIQSNSAEPTSTISPTPSLVPTNVNSCILKTCNISSENVCVYSFATQSSSLVVALKFDQQQSSSNIPYLVVGDKKFICTVIDAYPDRLYCTGVSVIGSNTLQVISPNNDTLCSGTFFIPQYVPPSPSPKKTKQPYP